MLVGGCTRDRAGSKTASMVDLGLPHEIEQMRKLGFGLTRKTSNKGAAQHQLGAGCPPTLDTLQILLPTGRALHAPQNIRVAVLKRYIKVGQHLSGGQQGNHLVHAWVRVHRSEERRV